MKPESRLILSISPPAETEEKPSGISVLRYRRRLSYRKYGTGDALAARMEAVPFVKLPDSGPSESICPCCAPTMNG